MSKMIKIRAFSGHMFYVDTSDEACGEFGFKHGDRVIHKDEGEGTVVGVAPYDPRDESSDPALWLRMDHDHGLACYIYREQVKEELKLLS